MLRGQTCTLSQSKGPIMVTRVESGVAGLAAIGTSVALTVSMVLFGGGPPSARGNVVRDWYAANATSLRIGALAWVLAMVGLVAFAVGFREALWATVLDRNWAVLLFVQGAVVFATIAVVRAALGWSLADQAVAGAVSADLAGMMWAIERTLLRFATWGLTVPLVLVGLALARHSLMGQIAAAASVIIAVALLVPITWTPAMFAFCAWLAFAGLTLLMPMRQSESHPEFVR